MADLKDLIKISRHFGGDSDYLLAGGGNTSLKEDGILYVKASGFPLADITKKGFVRMSMDALEEIWKKDYPENQEQREAAVLADMLAARLPGEDSRPSVEALLHSLIKGRYVIHTHPALVNGLTCGRYGESLIRKLFENKAIWVPSVNPGFILAAEVRSRILNLLDSGSPYPRIIFLQNHGREPDSESPRRGPGRSDRALGESLPGGAPAAFLSPGR